MIITAGSTNVSLPAYMVDSTAGTPETGITIANLDLQYTRLGSTPSAKVDATALAATNTAHTDNYAIELDATDQPGVYRVDWPDAAFAAGANCVVLSVIGTGYAPCHTVVWLAGVDVTSVNNSTADVTAKPYLSGTFTGTPSTTAAETSTALIQAFANDTFNNWKIRVTSGNAKGDSATISDFVTGSGGGTGFTYATLGTAPASGDTFDIYKP